MSRKPVPVPEWLDVDELAGTSTHDRSWLTEAACAKVDPATFMPRTPKPGETFNFTDAARVCRRCPVRLPCLAVWLAATSREIDKQTGTYVGDTTPTERVAVRRALRARTLERAS